MAEVVLPVVVVAVLHIQGAFGVYSGDTGNSLGAIGLFLLP